MKQLLIGLLLLTFSQLLSASTNTNPQFEFGTISADKCIAQGPAVTCDIDFENSYSSPPLVFVMSTINASRSNFTTKTTEYPSALRVWSVTNSKAVIKQRIAPHAKACSRLKYKRNNKGEWLWQCVNNTSGEVVNYIDAPMENIDYLVIEPGVLEFDNGAKIVAGSFSTKKTISGRDNKGSGTSINFNSYGLSSSFSSAPGVLVQLQSKENNSNGEPLWLTATAKNPSRYNVTVMLDRSEVTNNSNLTNPEEVAFVAGLGEGFVQGRKFWLGQGSTQNTLSLNDKVIKPITEGCKQFVNFSGVSFNKVPTLIASKSARNGPNGGWLRRCSVTKNGVSLIVEEDMNKDAERSHTLEPFSYFLFDKPPTNSTCALFPSPTQTWENNTHASIIIENNANISGAPISGGKRYIGFESNEITDRKSKGCDGSQCFGDVGLKVEKQQLESFQSPDSGLDTVVVQSNQTRTFQNNESIGTLTVNNKAKVVFKTGKYWVDSINVIGSIDIPSGNVVEIHTKGFSLSNGSHFSALDNGELTVFVHDLSYNGGAIHEGVNLSNNSKFVGLLYSEKSVVLSNNATVEGAVTAKTVTLHNGSEIVATNKCFEPSDDYNITMTPESDYSLMCGTDQPVFTINTTNNNVLEGLHVTASILPTSNADDFTITAHNGVGSGAYPNFSSSDLPPTIGTLQLKVAVNNVTNIDLSKTYSLVITMDDDPSKSDSSTIKYVPFKFSVDDQSVIAGKEYDVTAKVLACNDNGTTVVTSYTGTPTVAHTLNQPTSGVDGVLGYSPVFSSDDKGITQDTFSISESGLFTIKLTDSSFDCAGISGCPIDGNGQLTGSFDVESRPWKLAICDVENIDGTIVNPAETDDINGGFISAGSSFKASFKPIVHPDFYTTLPVDECNYQTTYNYFTETGHITPLKLTFELAYPNTGILSNLDPSNFPGDYSFISGDKVGNVRQKTVNLSWQEVGALNLKSDAAYYGENLQQDTQVIGRFYPKYFIQDINEWIVADQNNVAYLSQPYDSAIHTVYPMASGQSDTANALNNYRFFSSTLQAEFGVLDDSNVENDFLLDTTLGTWDPSRVNWSLDDDNAMLKRHTTGNVSRKDRPFNTSDGNATVTNFGLTVTGTDPVSFTDSDPVTNSAAFPVQPPARYGRMALDDIGGNSGATLIIPLRAEFWNGSDFVVNTDDDKSTFNGANYCKQVIWHSESKTTTNALFNGSGTVSDGEDDINASQNTPSGADSPREQARLWLRMEDDNPSKKTGENDISCLGSNEGQPWLRYNWRQLGDEDPSTVVTFGIYRGNDRVIYRGESGLTGQ
ncbi:DUF6701 domain-containing protein [Vibrio fortis]|uniref:DUF6701 domain-containing protein n=1 Tax=Vibrio fortis TaxID=212667 RepID=UPI003EB9E88B